MKERQGTLARDLACGIRSQMIDASVHTQHAARSNPAFPDTHILSYLLPVLGEHPGFARGAFCSSTSLHRIGDTEGAQGVLNCPLGNTLLSELCVCR